MTEERKKELLMMDLPAEITDRLEVISRLDDNKPPKLIKAMYKELGEMMTVLNEVLNGKT